MSYKAAVKDDTEISNGLAEFYQEYHVYEYRRLTACLRRKGYDIKGKTGTAFDARNGPEGNLSRSQNNPC